MVVKGGKRVILEIASPRHLAQTKKFQIIKMLPIAHLRMLCYSISLIAYNSQAN